MSKNELEVSKIFQGDISIPYKKRIEIVENYILSIVDDKNAFGNGKEIIYPPITKYKHSFADGVYIREMAIDKGVILTGFIHKYKEAFFLLKGRLIIMTKSGVEEYIAPCYVITPQGSKKMGYSVEESIVVTIHANPTNTRDLKELENNIVVYSWDEYDEFVKQNKK
jgi:phosphopantothenoylcysteine synthetase/decarboxylase